MSDLPDFSKLPAMLAEAEKRGMDTSGLRALLGGGGGNGGNGAGGMAGGIKAMIEQKLMGSLMGGDKPKNGMQARIEAYAQQRMEEAFQPRRQGRHVPLHRLKGKHKHKHKQNPQPAPQAVQKLPPRTSLWTHSVTETWESDGEPGTLYARRAEAIGQIDMVRGVDAGELVVAAFGPETEDMWAGRGGWVALFRGGGWLFNASLQPLVPVGKEKPVPVSVKPAQVLATDDEAAGYAITISAPAGWLVIGSAAAWRGCVPV